MNKRKLSFVFFDCLENLYIKIFFTAITFMVIYIVYLAFYNWTTPLPYRGRNFIMIMSDFRRDFYAHRNYFITRIESGDLPALGVFERGMPETIWAESVLYMRKGNYPGNATIVSLDYQTGRLYVGFTDLFFLKNNFKYKQDMINFCRGRHEGLYGSSLFLQNINEEPYRSGDVILTLAAILSSEDVNAYKQKYKD